MSSEYDAQVSVDLLLETALVAVRDVRCRGGCRHRSSTECATSTQLVFPYRGVFVRHVGLTETVAEANQLVFFNDGEEYRVSHPVDGGDACLSIAVDQDVLRELVPAQDLAPGPRVALREAARTIDARSRRRAAALRGHLHWATLQPLAAEGLVLDLIAASLQGGRRPSGPTTFGATRIARRAKLTMAGDSGRRWTLADLGDEVGVSPVHLAQSFARAEGMPLYRYQLQLRLALALEMIGRCEDITALALELGFSSHSHFSAAFRRHYGCSPTEFRRSVSTRHFSFASNGGDHSRTPSLSTSK